MERWIEKYIESNYKEDNVIELFFQALSEIDHQHKNAYLVLYYQKGHDINVLRQAILKNPIPIATLKNILEMRSSG